MIALLMSGLRKINCVWVSAHSLLLRKRKATKLITGHFLVDN